ncbi:hypothetical protein [Mycobacterium sp. D16Q13]|uniref:hypothetical protein n=1 Tax=Mycobacterium sp. D16Q13 TaxID=1855657 RepID=UPI0009941468|nr:hypothetical protein [Mycobacterium sp. D16Q13]
MWTRGGPGDGAFEVVKKLFDDGVMRRDHERGEFDPITETAFKVEGVRRTSTPARRGAASKTCLPSMRFPFTLSKVNSTNRREVYAVHVYPKSLGSNRPRARVDP